MKKIITALLCVFATTILIAQDIKVNQIGYYLNAQKLAIIPETEETTFSIVDMITESVVYTGSLSEPQTWNSSGESNIRTADFSDFKTVGSYYITSGDKTSHIFSIAEESLFSDLSVWSIKAFYLWRASTAIESEYATFNGIDFSRAAGHADTAAVIHSSAATEQRPTGTKVSSPKGWYDAGDYNKYVVNANPAVFPMLHAYELFPDYFNKQNLNIPESGNELPDLLDEVKWELDWLLSMQDPNDGGVYFKLTDASFTAMVMPASAPQGPRYLVSKSTTATLDFAAMMAKAYRTFKNFETVLPGYADSCLQAAKLAFTWAKENPKIYFTNPSGISTGGYGDKNASDEFYWAQIELYLSTGNEEYLNDLPKITSFTAPSWPDVQTNGLLSVMHVIDTLQISDSLKNVFSQAFYIAVDGLEYQARTSAYKISISSFYWGSNGTAASQGMLLASAYQYSQNEKYLDASVSMLDYLLGKNATPYSFVTGFGTTSPMHIHDRRAEADGIVDPMPGYLAGGPNAGNQSEDCGVSAYPSTYGAKSYLDRECSYSTNEIAINWNGPLVFLTGAIEAVYSDLTMKPLSIQTNTSGTVITVQYPESISEFSSGDITYTIKANDIVKDVDTILLNENADNEILIVLNDTIKSTDTIITISSDKDSVFSVSDIRLASIDNIIVLNNSYGAAPVIINAVTSNDGLGIYLTFNKDINEVDTLFDQFTVYQNGEDVFQHAYIDTAATNSLFLTTTQLYRYDYIGVSYSGNAIVSSEGGIMQAVDMLIVENKAPEKPSQLLKATSYEDGYTIDLIFDKTILQGGAETPVNVEFISNNDTISVAIESFSILDKTVTLNLQTRYSFSDTIIVSSNEDGLTTMSEEAVYPFLAARVENILPQPQYTTVDSINISRIEAEDYVYNYGFQTEECSDIGGGENVGYTDTGDWMDYFIDVKHAGTYTFVARVASQSQASEMTIQLVGESGIEQLCKIETPQTGSWQKWASVYNTIELAEGKQTLRIYASDELFNINWFELRYGVVILSASEVVEGDNVIYPNPCNDRCFVSVEYDCKVSVSALSGQIVKTFTANAGEVIELNLDAGVYIVDFGKEQKKLIVY